MHKGECVVEKYVMALIKQQYLVGYYNTGKTDGCILKIKVEVNY